MYTLPEESRAKLGECIDMLSIKMIILKLPKMFGHCAQCPGIA